MYGALIALSQMRDSLHADKALQLRCLLPFEARYPISTNDYPRPQPAAGIHYPVTLRALHVQGLHHRILEFTPTMPEVDASRQSFLALDDVFGRARVDAAVGVFVGDFRIRGQLTADQAT